MTQASFARGGLAAIVLMSLAPGAPAQDQPVSPQAHERFRWPLRGPVVQKFKAGASDGIDIGAPVGEPVHAAADGVCIAANADMKTYGKLVVIRHEDGYVTVYADNSEIIAKEGDKVRRGEIIAKSGQTGGAATPRLHFEIRKDGKPIDPTRYLVPL